MVHFAAWLAGFGGLLLEMVFLRRHGLLLGNTASASALVLALFLLGLGVGGLCLPRIRLARRRPLGVAALLYALVAVVSVIADAVLATLPPLGAVQGFALCVIVPGVPAVLMGGAFPLLFSRFDRHAAPWHSSLLVGANLGGSVIAAFVGGNFAIPLLGLSVSGWLAAASYGVAAMVIAFGSRSQRSVSPGEPPPLPGVGRLEWLALAAGFVVLGLEVLMLRRLPFFLDGFQPTLSGVLATCLLGLTLGSWFGPPLLRRLFGARAAAVSILAGVVVLSLGLHEWIAPGLGRMGVDSEFGFHLRIGLAALVAVGPPCFFFGATIPLCLHEFRHPETRAPLAGRLFFFQGVGSLLGALVVGHVLPQFLPTTLFLYGLTAVSLAGLALATRSLGFWVLAGGTLVALLGWTGVTGGAPGRHDAAPVAGSRYDHADRYRYLSHRTDSVLTASVVYDRRAHAMILFTDEFRAAYINRDSGYMSVLGHLPFLLRDELSRVAVVALGTGTTANAVSQWSVPKEIHVVEISAAVVSLVDHFAHDGPGVSPERAPFILDSRTRVHVTDGRRFIARTATADLDLISMEPLLPYAPGTVPLYTREFYELCNAALSPEGLMVQWVPTHSMPEHYFRTLLATFARGFAHHSVWLINHSVLLVGSKNPHLPPLESLRRRMNAMRSAARRDLHGAGIAVVDDWVAAFVSNDILGVCGDAPDLRDDRPFLENIGYWSAAARLAFLPDNLEILRRASVAAAAWPADRDWSGLRGDRLQGLIDRASGVLAITARSNALAVRALVRARRRLPRSVLLHGELRRARRELLEKELMVKLLKVPWSDQSGLEAFIGGVDRRRLIAQLERDPDSPFLWAVLARTQKLELDQHDAAFRALAEDPGIYGQWPRLRLPWLERDEIDAFRGPFENMVELPVGEALLVRAAATSEDAVALRARFRVPVGHGFVRMLASRALRPAEIVAFRSVLDPALLEYAVRQVRSRGGDVAKEVLPLWRKDLALPTGLANLTGGTIVQRRELASALRGRKGELTTLARLLLDSNLSVRTVAGVSLFQTVGSRVEYDPEWDAGRRRQAVQQLRRLEENR